MPEVNHQASTVGTCINTVYIYIHTYLPSGKLTLLLNLSDL